MSRAHDHGWTQRKMRGSSHLHLDGNSPSRVQTQAGSYSDERILLDLYELLALDTQQAGTGEQLTYLVAKLSVRNLQCLQTLDRASNPSTPKEQCSMSMKTIQGARRPRRPNTNRRLVQGSALPCHSLRAFPPGHDIWPQNPRHYSLTQWGPYVARSASDAAGHALGDTTGGKKRFATHIASPP